MKNNSLVLIFAALCTLPAWADSALPEAENACLQQITVSHRQTMVVAKHGNGQYSQGYALLNLDVLYKLGVPVQKAMELSRQGAHAYLRIKDGNVIFKMQVNCLTETPECYQIVTQPLTAELLNHIISVSLQDIGISTRSPQFGSPLYAAADLIAKCSGLGTESDRELAVLKRQLGE